MGKRKATKFQSSSSNILRSEDNEEKKKRNKKENVNKNNAIKIKQATISKEKKEKQIDDTSNLSYVYILLKYFFENINIEILNEQFYLQKNVLTITEILIGHILWVYNPDKNILCGSRIIELESYNGINDKASHAYNNKKTNRNIPMFLNGGISYVYLCYGMHNCLNIVTNIENVPDAILIRSIEPIYNIPFFALNKFQDLNEINNLFSSDNFINQKGNNLKNNRKFKIKELDKMNVEKKIDKKNCANEIIKKSTYLVILQQLETIFKSIKYKQLVKLGSGPGRVTKCLGVTRDDDKKEFYFDICNDNNISNNQNNKINAKENNQENLVKAEKVNDSKNWDIKDDCSGNFSKIIDPKYYFSYNVNNFLNEKKKSRFFISICPSVEDVLNFYENLNLEKNSDQYFIIDIYKQYKIYLLKYFEYMKWKKNQDTIVQRDKRIGVAYAEEYALYDYRFILKNHPSISVLPK
ncbi:DNA-3-methyladenine glycosylase, putative [Plasmodium berghei]|uniref:DNA-3-methyladenine glycosylase II n=2 Tax=Plasmodium berghei TaxID=5821 RepID=A0A509AQS6_PLABA|nr:DNA-3-methyladenine glycosylase, putative [Plasmodium berghei ANKA]CXI95938.1 DNA-3-methyladenine glycosylase, putative [Plasmodium berghei]SCL97230.1 DNA-3-methyladenine glycosylase, putative [Plasmodium berghei]SCM16579.1 DNA-3-methyladenine glycosylase, putative [Plasmodium berghei]SCM18376.1 DNA-3-methyladenine glycosylase, putative [Plasmodium berghei]SCN27806.1 DNA-3-methyladenine glycosylase, putative [Plasmodium berghei]|eukprot:XP_034423460.1 DNA-3-methyladenine glycosylase, putative [Plasmodium berghei ANKA]